MSGQLDLEVDEQEAEPQYFALEPVEIEILARCVYESKPCGLCGKAKTNPVHRKSGGSCAFAKRMGCAKCNQPKSWEGHYGAPPTFNAVAGRNPNVYREAIKTWGAVVMPHIEKTGLERGHWSVRGRHKVWIGITRIVVEGVCRSGTITLAIRVTIG
jgi:hypothetical protein